MSATPKPPEDAGKTAATPRTTPAKIRQGLRAGGAAGAAWTIARLMHTDGATDAAIARAIGVSDEAVRVRRHAEGWADPAPSTEQPLAELAASTTLAADPTQPVSADDLTVILTALAAGVNLHLAARCAGLTFDQLDAIAEADPTVRRALGIAAARAVGDKIQRINEAGKRGDWKADAYLLERLPESKEQFRGDAGQSNAGVTVILNFDRDALAVPTGRVIDHEDDQGV